MKNLELWDGVKEGNTKSFENLHKYYHQQMLNYAVSLGFAKETVEDILQNIFIKLFVHREQLPKQVNIRSYLLRTVINALLDHCRKRSYKFISLKEIIHLPMQEIHTEKPFNSEGEYDHKLHIFRRHLKNLSKKQRKAIHLRFIKDTSWEEMSAILKISPHSCMNLVNRSITKLKKAIKDEQYHLIFM